MSYTYKYPHFALAVDIVVVATKTQKLLLIQRKNEPFKGQWALPGGYVEIDETTENAAFRELKEETGVSIDSVKRVDVFDKVDRDPRERTISVAYLATVDDTLPVIAEDDADDVRWFDLHALPALAFDHHDIIAKARSLLPGE